MNYKSKSASGIRCRILQPQVREGVIRDENFLDRPLSNPAIHAEQPLSEKQENYEADAMDASGRTSAPART